MLIIGIAGRKQSGKGTVADSIREAFPEKLVYIGAYGEELKRLCMRLFGLTYGQCYGSDAAKNTLTCLAHPVTGRPMTAREVLQYVGTDLVRRLDPDAWVRALDYTWVEAHDDGFDLFLVTDVRFPNEVEAIQREGGKVILLRRGEGTDGHESECSLPSFEAFDAVIDNRAMSPEEQGRVAVSYVHQWLAACE